MKTSPPPFTFQLAWDRRLEENGHHEDLPIWWRTNGAKRCLKKMMVAIRWSSCYRQICSSGSMSSKIFLFILGEPGKYPTWRHVTPAGSCRELLTPIIHGMSKVWSVHHPWSWPRDTESDLRRQGDNWGSGAGSGEVTLSDMWGVNSDEGECDIVMTSCQHWHLDKKGTLTTAGTGNSEDLPDGLLTGENWRRGHEESREYLLSNRNCKV